MGFAGCERSPQEKSFQAAQCSEDTVLVVLGLQRALSHTWDKPSVPRRGPAPCPWLLPLAADAVHGAGSSVAAEPLLELLVVRGSQTFPSIADWRFQGEKRDYHTDQRRR